MRLVFKSQEYAAVLVDAVGDRPEAGFGVLIPVSRARFILENHFDEGPRGQTDLRDLWEEFYGDLEAHQDCAHLCSDVLEHLGDKLGEGQRLFVFEVAEGLGPTRTRVEVPSPPAQASAAEEPPPEEEEEPRIVSVEWVETSADAVRPANDIQFVNIPKDSKYLHGEVVRNVDQLGVFPRIKVRFDKEGVHAFTVKLVPGSGNSVYSAEEQGKESAFSYSDAEEALDTDGNGEFIIEDLLSLAAAGDDTWTVQAEDQCGNTVTSRPLKTKKLIWITELKMPGLPVASSISAFKTQFSSNGYTVIDGDEVAMPMIENIGSSSSQFLAAASTAYRSSGIRDKEPYTVAVAYTNHLAKKGRSGPLRKTGVTVGPGAAPVRIPVLLNVAGELKRKPLWNNLVTGEGWFVTASYFSSAGGFPTSLAESTLTPSGDWASAPGYLNLIDVDVTGLPAGTGTIVLRVNLVKGMRAGLSYRRKNLIVTSAMSYWRGKSTPKQNQVLIHEMGHKVGMIPKSTDSLTPPPYQYTEHQHVGSHCHNGVALPAGQQTAFPNGSQGTTCVMFGATNGVSTFCSECGPLVKKLDSSDGWGQPL